MSPQGDGRIRTRTNIAPSPYSNPVSPPCGPEIKQHPPNFHPANCKLIIERLGMVFFEEKTGLGSRYQSYEHRPELWEFIDRHKVCRLPIDILLSCQLYVRQIVNILPHISGRKFSTGPKMTSRGRGKNAKIQYWLKNPRPRHPE